jgi:hypothetical protein
MQRNKESQFDHLVGSCDYRPGIVTLASSLLADCRQVRLG